MRQVQPGCYGVVQTRSFVGSVIRLLTRSRFNHAFIVCDILGTILQADPTRGISYGTLDQYAHDVVAFNDDEPLTTVQRQEIVAHARSLNGIPYGFLDIVVLGFGALGVRLPWLALRSEHEHQLICSQFVAVCGQAAGLDWLCGKPSPAAVTPGDLAERLSMRPWETA